MQVYFIDNDEYFKRKNAITEDDGSYYHDNDERSMFFCRGVLETVKKLGWKPQYDLAGLVKEMVASDLEILKRFR